MTGAAAGGHSSMESRRPMPIRIAAIVALAAGSIVPLAFAPFGFFFLTPLALAILFWLWSEARPGSAFLYGLLFGLTSFLGGTYWTYISVRDFGGAPLALSVATTLGLVLILSLFVAVAGWLAVRWLRARGVRAWLATFPAIWVLAEWCRGFMFTGFGWLSVGYSQTDSWLMSLAPVFGQPGVSFATALSAGALLTLVRGRGVDRRRALALLAIVWGGAWLLGGHRWTEPHGNVVTIAIAQGAIGQELKWTRAQYEHTLALYRDLTEAASGQSIIVWPEVAIPNYYDNVTGYLDGIRASVAASGSTVVLGILHREQGMQSAQNAVVALTQPPQFYIKRHLVPFGEYFPVPALVRRGLQLLDLPYTDLEPGSQDQPLLAIAGEEVAVTICYEDVFGAEQLGFLPDATLLINVSNDAWFGDSIAADQHLQIARMRAAEVGRYLLRSTNTGISAVIDPQGRVVNRAPEFEPAVIRDSVQGFRGATPYVLWGNYAILALLAIVLAFQLPITKLTMRSGT
jgi:apolipoprotein N-acyltransferase